MRTSAFRVQGSNVPRLLCSSVVPKHWRPRDFHANRSCAFALRPSNALLFLPLFRASGLRPEDISDDVAAAKLIFPPSTVEKPRRCAALLHTGSPRRTRARCRGHGGHYGERAGFTSLLDYDAAIRCIGNRSRFVRDISLLLESDGVAFCCRASNSVCPLNL